MNSNARSQVSINSQRSIAMDEVKHSACAGGSICSSSPTRTGIEYSGSATRDSRFPEDCGELYETQSPKSDRSTTHDETSRLGKRITRTRSISDPGCGLHNRQLHGRNHPLFE